MALADPPALNRDPCAAALASASSWPGTTDDGVRLVSDAYDSYLSRSGDCGPDPTTR